MMKNIKMPKPNFPPPPKRPRNHNKEREDFILRQAIILPISLKQIRYTLNDYDKFLKSQSPEPKKPSPIPTKELISLKELDKVLLGTDLPIGHTDLFTNELWIYRTNKDNAIMVGVEEQILVYDSYRSLMKTFNSVEEFLSSNELWAKTINKETYINIALLVGGIALMATHIYFFG